jgi:integrase
LADVKVWSIQRRSGERHRKPYIIRWKLNGRFFARSYRTKTEADRVRTALLVAVQSGEAFDEVTGEPMSWQPAPAEIQVHRWARRWLAEQWPEWAPRTRTSAVEAITRLLPLLVDPAAPLPPPTLRAHLASSLPPDGPGVLDEAERWLELWGLHLGQLTRPLLAGMDVDGGLGLSVAGKPLAPSTSARYRKVSKACIQRAVDVGIIPADPWPPAPRGRSKRKATRINKAAAVRNLPDPSTMVRILDAIVTHQPGSRKYQVMTAVAYYAGLRPSEVIMLRAGALELPQDGWGRIHVTEADIDFDEPGEPKTGPRIVPIPPELVDVLRAWLEDNGFSVDDLLFRTRTGAAPTRSNWARALHRAQRECGSPELRVYDCRHAAATTWLRAGVPLGEVAKRMGHSVETLVSTYAGVLEGDETLGNQRISAALAGTKKGPIRDVAQERGS